jgi:hypothetical protein
VQIDCTIKTGKVAGRSLIYALDVSFPGGAGNGCRKPRDSDVKRVLEAHGLLPEGPLLDEALGLTSLYADRIRQVLGGIFFLAILSSFQKVTVWQS